MILLTTETGFLTPFAWLLGQIFNGLFELMFLIVGWFTERPWVVPIVAIGIILFTIVIRLLLLPLTIKQQKFSKLQNIMNPEVQEIQAKYKDKKDNDSMMKMQEETKAVYAKYGASPSGGCLVMLIQLPIMFALYRVIYKIPGYVAKIKAISAVLAIASASTLSQSTVTVSTDTYKAFDTAYAAVSTAEDFDKLDSTVQKNLVDSVLEMTSEDWVKARDTQNLATNLNKFLEEKSTEAEGDKAESVLSKLGYSEADQSSFKQVLEDVNTYTSFKALFAAKKAEFTSTSYTSYEKATIDQFIDVMYNLTDSQWDSVIKVMNSPDSKVYGADAHNFSELVATISDDAKGKDGKSVLSGLGYSKSQISSIHKTMTALEKQYNTSAVNIEQVSGVIQGYNTLFGLNMMENPWSVLTTKVMNEKKYSLWWVVLIPILAGGSQFASSMLMQSKTKQVVGQKEDEKQQSMQQSMKMMNYLMPLMSVVFCFMLSACIGLYWIASSVIQTIVQIIINKKMDNMDLEEMVKKNIEKENEKRAKKGLPPRKYVNTATSYAEKVKIQEARDARKEERNAEIKESTQYYENANVARPGSLAAKANMVKMFNERNNVSDKKKEDKK